MKNLRIWLQGANASIYSCHLLASWSGRMWAFYLGLVLIMVSPKSLQLSATYGLCMGAAVLIFGPIIGDWVDKTPRLKAAIMSMIFQNLLIATCACVVFTLIMLLSEMAEIADWLRHLFYAIIIILSVCSRLMKEARIIVVERDWIVEMCAKDEHHLAVMTSSFQRLDLVTKILAPVVTGQILTFAGLKIGCGFITVWSLVSLGIEYYLIRRVYNIVPALKSIKSKMGFEGERDYSVDVYHDDGAFDGIVTKSRDTTEHNETEDMKHVNAGDDSSRRGCYVLWQVLDSFLILYRGLKTYFRSVTMWPGLALAFLYLTVLTMGHITVGYGTMQGLSGSILGILTGVGAGFGILATAAYPHIVRKLGLPITGVLALGLQVTCLTLCVISVWLPGSPFDLFLANTVQVNNGTFRNCSAGIHNTTQYDSDESIIGQLTSDLMTNVTSCVSDVSHSGDSRLSVWVMIAGIVLARFGLWTGHMAIVQIFLEKVAVRERGIINGFQTSLNQLLGFMKYSLVVILPHPHQFGLLVFISYAFICTAWMFMGVNAVKESKRRKIEVYRKKNQEILRVTGEIKTVL